LVLVRPVKSEKESTTLKMFVYVVTFNELVYGVFTSREKAQRAIRKYVDNEEEGINENSFFINQRELDED
jgi:hypothetical protein